MVKIKAFFISLAMFLVFVIAIQFACSHVEWKSSQKHFGTWSSMYKDISRNGIASNLRKDDMLVMGSSEFRHCVTSPYHISKIFKGTNVHVMTIGAAANQSLFHTIALGSLEPKLKKRKVVLFVSPTWFKGSGVNPNQYAVRFSESEYDSFMWNQKISPKVKKYVAKRTEHLVKSNKPLSRKVKLIHDVQTNTNLSIPRQIGYLIGRNISYQKEFVSFHVADFLAEKENGVKIRKVLRQYRRNTKKKNKAEAAERKKPVKKDSTKLTPARDRVAGGSKKGKYITFNDADWKAFAEDAAMHNKRQSHNPCTMSDKLWNRKYRKLYETTAGSQRNVHWDSTQEYGDLKAFLDVCQQTGIEANLIILPVNGVWFDNLGIPADRRKEFDDAITKMAKKHGAKVTSLAKYNETPYVNHDATHPWEKGWVLINEAVYKAYQ